MIVRAVLVFSLLVGALVSVDAQAGGDDTMTLTKQQANEVIASGKLKRVKSKSDFPENWRSGMGLTDMADVNGPFSAGCTGPEPHSRMIAGAVSDHYGLLIYEVGGIAYFRNLKLYSNEKNGFACVYTESVDQQRILDIEKKIGK
jgi:hypothetical protein